MKYIFYVIEVRIYIMSCDILKYKEKWASGINLLHRSDKVASAQSAFPRGWTPGWRFPLFRLILGSFKYLFPISASVICLISVSAHVWIPISALKNRRFPFSALQKLPISAFCQTGKPPLPKERPGTAGRACFLCRHFSEPIRWSIWESKWYKSAAVWKNLSTCLGLSVCAKQMDLIWYDLSIFLDQFWFTVDDRAKINW